MSKTLFLFKFYAKNAVLTFLPCLTILLLASCSDEKNTVLFNSSCLDVEKAIRSRRIPSGEFQYGDDRFYPDERPVSREVVSAFEIDTTEVTNQQFKRFVEATGYVTDAEKGLSEQQFPDLPPEFRVPGSVVFVPPTDPDVTNDGDWWRFIAGANWRNPQGPDSSIEGMDNFPVVQVTYSDAVAYADWVGRRLPTEIEWEYAARGGLDGAKFTWGNQPHDEAKSRANTWQGQFPFINDGSDGYVGISPVGCYDQNGYGLFDTAGNVWELTESSYHFDRQMPYRETGYDPRQPGVSLKTIKGGSFLCADNYCRRYRPSARQGQDITLATSHIGFRTATDVPL